MGMAKPDKVPKGAVGFGDEYSRSRITSTMNAFVRVETRPVSGGADVCITPRRGYIIVPEVDHDSGQVTVRIRKGAGTCRRVFIKDWLWECSECHSRHDSGHLYNFCPNCGARIEAE